MTFMPRIGLKKMLPATSAGFDGRERGQGFLFSWLVVAFVLRATVALATDFTIHPDEIMQYLEPAHRAVFGNGIVTWAYQYGARNWIVPGFVASMLWALDKAGLGVPWVYVYVVKLAFCALSLLVPWGAYHFARRTLGEDSARFALILTCLWPYLVIYAHKPFTEFVSTSLLFFALGLASRRAGETRQGAFAIGAALALAGAVRMQYLPLVAIAWVARLAVAGRSWALLSMAGGLAMVVFVALLEMFTWGVPFHSYYWNFITNFEVNRMGARIEVGWLYYFEALSLATGGGALVALYAAMRNMKRHLLFAAMALALLALHMMQPHKEMRFVFVLIPIILTVMADQLALWSKRIPSVINIRTAGVAASLSLALFLSVFFHDRQAIYKEKLFNIMVHLPLHHDMFDIYLDFARLDNVKGVLHSGLNYIDTPGYYYLHHDVPLYDVNAYISFTKDLDEHDAGEFYSHLLVLGPFPGHENFVKLGGGPGGYSFGYVANASEQVKQWVQNSPITINKEFDIASKKLGIRNFTKDLMLSSPEIVVPEYTR